MNRVQGGPTGSLSFDCTISSVQLDDSPKSCRLSERNQKSLKLRAEKTLRNCTFYPGAGSMKSLTRGGVPFKKLQISKDGAKKKS